MKNLFYFFLMIIILIFTLSCKKNDEVNPGTTVSPGPISVQNYIYPTTVNSGESLNWIVTVNNQGDEVTVSRAKINEKVIEGWAVGYYDFTIDLPLDTYTVPKNSSIVVFEYYNMPVYNTGVDDLVFQNTIYIYSNGGDAQDIATYIVKTSSSSLSSKGLDSDYKLKGLIR